jgi:hypothetical protein
MRVFVALLCGIGLTPRPPGTTDAALGSTDFAKSRAVPNSHGSQGDQLYRESR